jgi:hypothetical protein
MTEWNSRQRFGHRLAVEIIEVPTPDPQLVAVRQVEIDGPGDAERAILPLLPRLVFRQLD